MEVGVFSADPSASPLYLQRHRITDEAFTLDLVVDAKPDSAGLDPYNKLIDRISDDNLRTVEVR